MPCRILKCMIVLFTCVVRILLRLLSFPGWFAAHAFLQWRHNTKCVVQFWVTGIRVLQALIPVRFTVHYKNKNHRRCPLSSITCLHTAFFSLICLNSTPFIEIVACGMYIRCAIGTEIGRRPKIEGDSQTLMGATSREGRGSRSSTPRAWFCGAFRMGRLSLRFVLPSDTQYTYADFLDRVICHKPMSWLG